MLSPEKPWKISRCYIFWYHVCLEAKIWMCKNTDYGQIEYSLHQKKLHKPLQIFFWTSEKLRFCYKKGLINTNPRTKALSFYTVESSYKASYNTSQMFCFRIQCLQNKTLEISWKNTLLDIRSPCAKRFTVCIIFFPNNIIPYYHHSAAFKVDYMCSSLLQLAPGSRDLSQAEKGVTVVTIWANVDNFEWKYNCHYVNFLRFETSNFLLSLR